MVFPHFFRAEEAEISKKSKSPIISRLSQLKPGAPSGKGSGKGETGSAGATPPESPRPTDNVSNACFCAYEEEGMLKRARLF